MIEHNLALWAPRGMEFLLLFFLSGFWLLLIILPILYVIYSIRQRQRIIKQLEELSREVHLLKQSLQVQQPDNLSEE